ncbi:hypothetical protein KFL_007020050 [Klebsormidium nitens]|uniref:AP2/ERF domain-containing protein n=1 Tax=Klebsormidium nitens TaxID=105231 RepID=A0A1Y1IS02_KLENI|nr:hypothetical protein KFL_007020050 [Klebsormidium nitens]|eukprot:GAQ90918.1 hypothetical protein KFL_007020050 [Klebsormidium nitens]
MWLQVTLPALDQTVTVGGSTSTYVRYVNAVGHALLKSVEIEIGGQRIDKHFDAYYEIDDELTVPAEKEGGLREMIGKYNEADNYEGGQLHTQTGQRTYYIPLKFWFNKLPGNALPLIALQYHEIKLNVELAPAAALVRSDINVVTPTSNGAPLSLIDCSLYVDYIYLDTDERRKFASSSHEFLVEQVQFTGDESIPASISASTQKIRLSFNHPVKELIWVVTPESSAAVNSKTGNMIFDFGEVAGVDYVQSAKLMLNGHDSSSSTALIEVKDGKESVYAIVDKEDEDRVRPFCWRYATEGNKSSKYVVKSKTLEDPFTRLSHMVIGQQPKGSDVVTFVDGDHLNLTKSNLKICTPAAAHAMKKKEASGTSAYLGVFEMKEGKPERRWRATLNGEVLGYYPEEAMAAYKYDLCKRAYGDQAHLNGVEEPEGFADIDAKSGIKKQQRFPIKPSGKKFFIHNMKRNGQVLAKGTYETFSEAEEACEKALAEYVRTQRENLVISRNEMGAAVLKAKVTREQTIDVLVDDDVFVELMVNDDGKATGLSANSARGGNVYFNSTKQNLSDYVMRKKKTVEEVDEAENSGMIIHHKNWKNEDNRAENLCYAPRSTNSQSTGPQVNKKRKERDTEIVGCSKVGDKWVAQIRDQGMKVHLGTFETAEEAGRAYDEAALRIHGVQNAPRLNNSGVGET